MVVAHKWRAPLPGPSQPDRLANICPNRFAGQAEGAQERAVEIHQTLACVRLQASPIQQSGSSGGRRHCAWAGEQTSKQSAAAPSWPPATCSLVSRSLPPLLVLRSRWLGPRVGTSALGRSRPMRGRPPEAAGGRRLHARVLYFIRVWPLGAGGLVRAHASAWPANSERAKWMRAGERASEKRPLSCPAFLPACLRAPPARIDGDTRASGRAGARTAKQ